MSYELDSREDRPCPCGKGIIVTETYSNDWNQVKSHTTFQCNECSAQYHIETEYYHRYGMCESRPVLVPNGRTLHTLLPGVNIYSTPVVVQLCYCFSFAELQAIHSEMLTVTACSTLKNANARKVVRMCRDSCKCGKLAFVINKVQEAIGMYHTLQYNHDSEEERLAEVRKHIIIL